SGQMPPTRPRQIRPPFQRTATHSNQPFPTDYPARHPTAPDSQLALEAMMQCWFVPKPRASLRPAPLPTVSRTKVAHCLFVLGLATLPAAPSLAGQNAANQPKGRLVIEGGPKRDRHKDIYRAVLE